MLSKWFRADTVEDTDPVRRVALRDAGARRLLTPEELDRKTAAVTGYQWGRWRRGSQAYRGPLSRLTEDYRLLYGGIDSDGITERARDITSVMAGVTKRHAVQVSCPVVMRDFYLVPDAERRLFAGIDRYVTPGSELGAGADAIRSKLVDLYDKLLGVRVTPHSPDVEAAYRLFVDVMDVGRRMEQGRGRDGQWFKWQHCDSALDLTYFEGILDDVVVEREGDDGWLWYEFDWDRVNDFMNGIDWSDPHYTAQSWVVVLASLLMDHRYLYLQGETGHETTHPAPGPAGRRRRHRGLRVSPAPGPRRRLPRQALRVRPGRRWVGPHELLRPQGEHSGRARHQPLGGARRGAPGRTHPLRPLRPQPGVLREVPPPDAGHQRGGCADELAHRRHRAQLERAQLRGLPDDDRAARRALCAGAAGTVPELRGVLRDLGADPLHPHRRCGPAARHRQPDMGPDHEWLLGNLTDSVDYLWGYAERHGVANRLVVVIGSDFGRTNFYNAQSGKDHWPIGSFVVMEKNRRWTGRAVGETDGLHFAERINPRTLRRDDRNGTIIYPKHVHKALRRYLGIENTPGARRFPFNNTDDFAFFG